MSTKINTIQEHSLELWKRATRDDNNIKPKKKSRGKLKTI